MKIIVRYGISCKVVFLYFCSDGKMNVWEVFRSTRLIILEARWEEGYTVVFTCSVKSMLGYAQQWRIIEKETSDRS